MAANAGQLFVVVNTEGGQQVVVFDHTGAIGQLENVTRGIQAIKVYTTWREGTQLWIINLSIFPDSLISSRFSVLYLSRGPMSVHFHTVPPSLA